MKHFVFVLLLAAIGKVLPAQPVVHFEAPKASESTFNTPLPGSVNNRFDFLLPNNNRMVIELYRIHLLEQIPDLDSLFRKIWEDLQPVYDSLTDPLKIRRVDYVNTGSKVRIRIKQYAAPGDYYSYKDDELVQLKMDQDTLRFKGYIAPEKPYPRPFLYTSNFYTVTLLLNNITDVAKLPDGILRSAITLLLPDLHRSLQKPAKKIIDNYYYGLYDLQQKKRVSPMNQDHMSFGRKHGAMPYVEAGIQYVRGAWVPSAGAGIEYYYNQDRYSKFAMRLLWEPHFYFQRDDKDKVVLQRNDFLTLKFRSSFKNSKTGNAFDFNQQFSFGAMIYRKGELFEKGTFKFSVPGLKAKNILIEPEFFFNKFFRNFSPSLKLTLNLE